jgi:hypothetical protein
VPGATHIRVRANGTLGPLSNPYEIFSYGFCLKSNAGSGVADADAIAAKVAAYHSDSRTLISTRAHLTEVAVSEVGPSGAQNGQTARVVVDVVGGSNGGTVPPQIAYRVSLSDGLRGRSHRGGWYVPLPAASLSADDPRMSANDAAGAAASAKDLIAALNSGPNAQQLIIASQVLGALVVTQVRVGRALDTIRSRRNTMVEDYQTLPIP